MGWACKGSFKVSNYFVIYKSDLQPLSQAIPSSPFYLSWLFLNGVLYNKFDKGNPTAMNRTRCTHFFIPHINDNNASAFAPAELDDDLHGSDVETKKREYVAANVNFSLPANMHGRLSSFRAFISFRKCMVKYRSINDMWIAWKHMTRAYLANFTLNLVKSCHVG